MGGRAAILNQIDLLNVDIDLPDIIWHVAAPTSFFAKQMQCQLVVNRRNEHLRFVQNVKTVVFIKKSPMFRAAYRKPAEHPLIQ